MCYLKCKHVIWRWNCLNWRLIIDLPCVLQGWVFCEIQVLLWWVPWFVLDARGADCIWRATHGIVFSVELCFWAIKLVGEFFLLLLDNRDSDSLRSSCFFYFSFLISQQKTLIVILNHSKRINSSLNSSIRFMNSG